MDSQNSPEVVAYRKKQKRMGEILSRLGEMGYIVITNNGQVYYFTQLKDASAFFNEHSHSVK